MTTKSGEISVDGLTLATICVKAVKEGKGLKFVAEQTGLKSATISQRLKTIRENYPDLAPYLKFAKGNKGGKTVTKIDKSGLSELQALIAQLTGAPPDVVKENGVAMVQTESINVSQREMLTDALVQQSA